MNKLTEEEKQRLWTHVYRNLDLPRPGTAGSTRTIESIRSDNTKFSNLPSPTPDVSTLGLHHIVRLEYPALEILTDPSERAVLHKPLNVQHRYQPLPLIADDSVYWRTGRDKATAVSFFSLYKATSDLPTKRTICKLLRPDMREATKYYGRTKLRVVIYMTPKSLSLMIRIRRSTTYFNKGGHEDREEQDYDFTYDEFFSQPIEGQWYEDILHLVTMRDDRSARSVQFQLWALRGMKFPGAADLFDRFFKSWKPRRQPDYEVYLKNLIQEVKRPSSMLVTKNCKLCRKPFKGDHKAASLPCCNKLISLRCLVEWCESFNAETLVPDFDMPSCPVCKAKIFHDPKTIEALKFGILADQYWPDKRYTEWENFERSCADLDRTHAMKTQTKMTINPMLFIQVWKKMVHQTVRTDEPHHLQPHLWPEFLTFENEIIVHIRCLAGVTSTPANLYSFLCNKIERDFRSRFQNARLDAYLPPGKTKILHLIWRTGFTEFVMRVLNRTIMFHVLRQCQCQKGSDMHMDGAREFYDPERCKRFVTADMGKVRDWQTNSVEGRKYLMEFFEGEEK